RAFRALLALPPIAARENTGIGAHDRAVTGIGVGMGVGVDESGDAMTVPADDPRCLLARNDDGWRVAEQAPADSRAVLDLYGPIRCHPGALTVAHLGQSLDGQIATSSGDSFYVTGAANLLHLQRMRALCDAVVVGAGTVAADDPRLTVRLAAGHQPVRVVLDQIGRASCRVVM